MRLLNIYAHKYHTEQKIRYFNLHCFNQLTKIQKEGCGLNCAVFFSFVFEGVYLAPFKLSRDLIHGFRFTHANDSENMMEGT